jgi:hypothetical protein
MTRRLRTVGILAVVTVALTTVTDAGYAATSAGLSITVSSFEGVVAGAHFSGQLSATGGTGNYTWSVSQGTLPPGLSLDPTTGVVSGTPTISGPWSLIIAVSDPGPPAQTATGALSFAIGAPGTVGPLKTKVNGSKLSVTATCAGNACIGTIALTGVEHFHRGKVTAVSARSVTLATGSYNLGGGERTTLALTLNSTARELLAQLHRLGAVVVFTPDLPAYHGVSAKVAFRVEP